MVHKTIKKCSEFIKGYIEAFKKAGADGVLMAEPAAGLLSPALCEEFSAAYIREIVKAVSDDNFVFIYHNCGNVVPLYETLRTINADVYHFGNSIDIETMLKLMPDKIIMGNLNPLLFRNGTPDTVRENTLALLNRCGKYDNYIISSGCDIPPMSSWDNINAFFEAVGGFYGKK
jgi:uroporphyrinogen decarboxylase